MIIFKNKKPIVIDVVKENNGVYVYYIGNTKIGAYAPNVMGDDNIIFKENTLENELELSIKDEINRLNLEEIETESKNGKIVNKIMEINLEKEIGVQEKEQNKKEDKKNKKEKDAKEKEDKELEKEKHVNDARKLNSKQELNANDKANDMQTIGQWLELPSDYVKLEVIDGNDRNKLKDEKGKSYENTTSYYSIVAVNKKGEAVPIEEVVPSFNQRGNAGYSPNKQEYQVEESGKIEKDNVLAQFEFGGGKTLSIENEDQDIKVYAGQEATTSTQSMHVQLETSTVWETDIQNRQIIGKYEENGMYTVDENIKEAENHEEEHLTLSEIDGEEQTMHSHVGMPENEYVPGTEITWKEFANKCGYRGDNIQEGIRIVQQDFDKIRKNTNVDINNKEIIERVVEDYERDYIDPKSQGTIERGERTMM